MLSIREPFLQHNRNISISCDFNNTNTINADSIIDLEINATMGDNYTIGNFTVRELQANLVRAAVPSVLAGQKLTVYAVAGNQNLKLGVFIIDPEGIEIERNTVRIKAYDALGKLGAGAVSPTQDFLGISLLAATRKICAIIGVDLSEHGLGELTSKGASFTIDIPKGGNTLQRTLRSIATALGETAVINADGELDFIHPTPSSYIEVDADYYTSFKLIDDMAYTLSGIKLIVPEEDEVGASTEYTYGDCENSHIEISANASNVYNNQTDLNNIASNIGIPYSYHGFNLTTVGLPFVELGDYIHLTDYDENTYTDLPVLKYTIRFDNGLTTEFGANLPKQQTINTSTSGGELSNTIATLVSNAVQTETILAQKIEADTARFNQLETDKADVSDLTATNARVSTLETDKADVSALNAQVARIDTLNTNLTNTNNLVANKADINFGNVNTANINQEWVNQLMVQGGLIAADGNFFKLVGARVYGDVIQANTIRANSLLLQGTNGLYYALNVDALGQATASSDPKYQAGIDGSVIVAHSITADEITANNIAGTGGWINLANGTFSYSNATSGNGIHWDGTNLTITADNISLTSGETLLSILDDVETVNTTVSTLQTEIEDFQIGGRNIARGTADMLNGTGAWETGTWRDVDAGTEYNVLLPDTPNRMISRGVRMITTTAGSEISCCQDNAPIYQGNYVMSCWIKGSTGGVATLKGFYWTGITTPSIYTTTITTNGEWQYVVLPLYSDEDKPQCSICYLYWNGLHVDDACYFCGIKLEKGTKPTDWTPAPEDDIDKLNTSITTINQNILDTNTAISKTNEAITTSAEAVLETVSETYSTKGELTGLQATVNNLSSTVSQTAGQITQAINNFNETTNTLTTMRQMLDSEGLHVKGTNNLTEAIIDGDQLVFKTTDGQIIAKFSNGDSEASYLAVKQWLAFGAHRVEKKTMKKYDDTTDQEGTAFFWIG